MYFIRLGFSLVMGLSVSVDLTHGRIRGTILLEGEMRVLLFIYRKGSPQLNILYPI